MAHPEQPDRDRNLNQSLPPQAPLLRPLDRRLRDAAKQAGVTLDIVQRDYAIGHLLAALASHPALDSTLVFKGGTALKKLYFTEYRFSEDLDFSGLEAPTGDMLEAAVRQAMDTALQRLRAHGPFDLDVNRYTLRDPHPHGQEAFNVQVRFPKPPYRIKLEISHDEPVLLPPVARELVHGYEEAMDARVLCYRLEEIVAEKMRTLLQTHQKLLARGWNRPRARDYYDLWRILGELGSTLDRAALPALLARKCAHRGVSFRCLDDFFPDLLIEETRRSWDTNLGRFVGKLPPCDEVLQALRTLVPRFFPDLP